MQVIDHDVFNAVDDSGVAREAQLAFQLRHPHIVATLKYVVKDVSGSLGSPPLLPEESRGRWTGE
jgi:hypothetical protein